MTIAPGVSGRAASGREAGRRAPDTEAAVDEKGLERRICQRFSIQGAAISYQKRKLLRFMMKVEEWNCPVLDLSRGGLCFLNQKPLNPDSKVSLQLFTPDEPIPVSLEGRVCWSIPSTGKSYSYEVGVQFSAYGLERHQNAPHLLDSLVVLETKFVEARVHDSLRIPSEFDAL